MACFLTSSYLGTAAIITHRDSLLAAMFLSRTKTTCLAGLQALRPRPFRHPRPGLLFRHVGHSGRTQIHRRCHTKLLDQRKRGKVCRLHTTIPSERNNFLCSQGILLNFVRRIVRFSHSYINIYIQHSLVIIGCLYS
jgi:hypothetical protein